MGEETDGKPPEDALSECEEKVAELKEENAELRNAAQTFGDLAERLNTNRRVSDDRRPEPRTRRSLPSRR